MAHTATSSTTSPSFVVGAPGDVVAVIGDFSPGQRGMRRDAERVCTIVLNVCRKCQA